MTTRTALRKLNDAYEYLRPRMTAPPANAEAGAGGILAVCMLATISTEPYVQEYCSRELERMKHD